MDIRFLQSFVMVVECGSWAEAARQLDLTPAAIAARVKSLEDALGVALIRRAGRTVKATEAGLRILAQSQGVLRDIRDLQAMARDDEPMGQLRLGVSTSSLTGVLPPMLKGLLSQRPKLAVHVEPGTSGLLYQRLTAGLLDAVIIVEPQFELPKTCDWTLLLEEPLILLAPAALAHLDPLGLLAREPFIRYDRAMWGGRLADRYLRERGLQPQERIEIDSLPAIAALVDQGLGVALVPDWAPPWPEGLKLGKLPLPPPVPVRRIDRKSVV
jgi:DNA-binding transcriptional LysR family regulator